MLSEVWIRCEQGKKIVGKKRDGQVTEGLPLLCLETNHPPTNLPYSREGGEIDWLFWNWKSEPLSSPTEKNVFPSQSE